MKSFPLPIPPSEYDSNQEAQFRRQLELEVLRINSTHEADKNFNNKDASLALRRHQFLLMGAS
jgi:hypothetical protein